ncbi:hypothetical protein DXG01_009813, partial [Tephrocybe rancida]
CFRIPPLPAVLTHTFLAHLGAYGASAKKVMAYVHILNQEIEHSPDYFHRLGYQERLTEVRAKIAQHTGADTDEVVLVRNATTGVNIVLRNFAWEKSDTLVTCSSPVFHDPTDLPLTLYPSDAIAVSTAYPTVDQTAQHLSDVSPYPSRKTIPLQFPTTVSRILQTFQSFASTSYVSPLGGSFLAQFQSKYLLFYCIV